MIAFKKVFLTEEQKKRYLPLHKPTLHFGGGTLTIVFQGALPSFAAHCGKLYGIWGDDGLAKYISQHVEEAYKNSIFEYEEGKYYLNTCFLYSISTPYASTKARMKMCEVYAPVIRKFIENALTDNLYVIEDGELKKQ